MNKENNKLLSEKYNELKRQNASQDEINKVMGKLYNELELCEISQLQAEEDARFETYLESLPDENLC